MTSARRRCAIPETERFWERVLLRLEEGTVVPVVGPGLLTLRNEDGKGETLLYALVAQRVAESLHVSPSDLPRGSELQEVARRYLANFPQDAVEIYRALRAVFRDLEPIAVPEPLLELARMPPLQLFVTTTFDVLTERAVDLVRFEGQRQTLAFAYAPNDKEDLPPELDRLNRPSVFHLMGRLSGTPHSYAVTREDTLAFIESLQSRAEDSPGFLFDKLRRSDLLILGCPESRWLARLFSRDPSGEMTSPIEPIEEDASPVLFVHRPDGRIEAYPGEEAPAFVSELYRRWTALPRSDEPAPDPSVLRLLSSPEIQSGVVFLSSVEADRREAEAIRDALDRAGVDVLLDCDDRPLGARWERKLRSFLGECALFVPLVSARSLAAPRRFFKEEWVQAVREAASSSPSGRFVLPVVLDGTTRREGALPKELGEIPWERNTPELVTKAVELQRSYRSARFA